MTVLDKIKDKIKELFGEEETKTEEKPKKVEESTTSSEKPTRPVFETPTYERLEYTPKTDEEIEQEVTDSLKDYKDSAMDSYDASFKKTLDQKNKEKELAKIESEEDQKSVTQSYNNKAKKIDYDLIKRGMVDSSSNSLIKDEHKKQLRNAIDEVTNNYIKEIKKLDDEIEKAEAKRQQAIADFNVTYALKFANTVSKLKQERDKKADEVVIYNNKISKQEFTDAITKGQTESDLYAEAINQYYQEKEIEERENNKEKDSYEYRIYTILRNQLLAMSKDEAREALRNDPIYADNLTTNYYLQLAYEFGA